MRADRFRFEVRRVDVERRVYVFVDDVPDFYSAVLYATAGRTQQNQHFVVWDSRAKCVTWDSRKLGKKFEALCLTA